MEEKKVSKAAAEEIVVAEKAEEVTAEAAVQETAEAAVQEAAAVEPEKAEPVEAEPVEAEPAPEKTCCKKEKKPACDAKKKCCTFCTIGAVCCAVLAVAGCVAWFLFKSGKFRR